MAQTQFEIFKDASYNTNNIPTEIRKQEEDSLVILPRREVRLPLPHELLDERVKRPLPHELLGLHVLTEQGSYKRVREYREGWHPEEGGTLIEGLTGQETVVERNSIEPLGIFEVEESEIRPLIHKYHGDYGLPEEECLNGLYCPFPEIIIDGKGTRREVRPAKFIPETPKEQIIVFPDKKQYTVNWRKNLEKLGEIGRLIEESEIVQEEGIYRVPLSNPEIPYAMGLIFSDAHIGSYTTDYELIVNLMDTVLSTPNSFLVDAGDTFDNGLWMGLQHEQLMPPYMQAFTVSDMIRELGDKYAACVIGNHPEWMFAASGNKPEQMFARQMKGPVFAGMGLLHLEVGNQKYDMALAHNFWGKSKINIHNVCRRLREHEYPDADVFVVGHEHIWGYMKEMNNDKERLYIRPGTAKLRDRYARIHGIAKRGQACGLAVVFGGEKREFNAYNLSDGVEMMKLKEELAKLK